MVILLKLISFLKPYKKECIAGPLFKLFEAILELLLPTMMAFVINKGVANRDIDYVFKMGMVMFAMGILGFGSSMICQYYAARASQGFGTSLRNKMFEHITSLSHSDMDKFGTSSLINRITNDVNQLQLAVAMLIRLVVRAPFICIGATVMAMFLDLKLALILIGTTPFFAGLLYLFITKTAPRYKIYQNKLDKLTLIIRENLGGVRVIRSFGKVGEEKERFNEGNEDLTDTAIRLGRVSALLNPMTSFVMNGGIIILLWGGAVRINGGELGAGTMIAFVNYMTQILLALIVVSNLIIIFTKASASAARINEILETKASIEDGKDPISEVDQKVDYIEEQGIEFRQVDFSYHAKGSNSLTDINITIKKGESIGIIGGTGSGKSTFVHLIPRFYEATSGEIWVDGIPVKDYPLEVLRRKIGIVMQQTELFTGTIEENLRWGNEDISDEELVRAAKIAQAHEFIVGLEDGYKAQVKRGGNNFSGGQKQRLAIARGLAKNPEILILDDSSSALDVATDAALRKAIKQNSERMTVLIVSQRISSIKDLEKIIVFHEGKIVGVGVHQELMNNCEVYREICLSQLGQEENMQ